MASKNGSKPRSNDEYETAYFLRGAGGFFAAALRDDVGFADDDIADDLVAGADGRGADRVLRGRVVPCERLPR